MASSKSGDLRVTLLCVALLGLLLLSLHAAPVDADESAAAAGESAAATTAESTAATADTAATTAESAAPAPKAAAGARRGKKSNSFSFNKATGARTLSSFSMNNNDNEKKPGSKGV